MKLKTENLYTGDFTMSTKIIFKSVQQKLDD
jgi:hypothetical protein